MKPFSYLWIGSTIITGIIVQILSSIFNFAIFQWGMLFILPIGAVATAYLNLGIFNLFCKIFRKKSQGNSILNATLGTVVIILMLANTDPPQTVLTVRYRSAVSSGVEIPSLFGWIIRITKIIGFWIISAGELLKQEKPLNKE